MKPQTSAVLWACGGHEPPVVVGSSCGRARRLLPSLVSTPLNMDLMFEWEYEGDRFSFEDSDRFEEDSLCSWGSEPESVCNNWRGWKRQNGGPAVGASKGE